MITRLAFIVLCSIAALGCAKTQMEAGTDGATHFLRECDRDADCGELSCVCGVCSEPCTGDGQCTALNDDAQCASPSDMSCEVAELACAIECDGDDACRTLGAGAQCEAERCVRPTAHGNDAGQGGTSAGTGGTSGTGVSGSGGSGGTSGTGVSGAGGTGSANPACRAMDARSNGDDCADPLGFAWNRHSCAVVNCGCEGSECDAIYPTRAACERVYAECAPPCSRMQADSKNLDCLFVNGFSWTGIECKPIVCGCDGPDCDRLYATAEECEATHRACPPLSMCTRPTDCALVDEQCCRCEIPLDELVSISTAEFQRHSERTCEPFQACPDCAEVPASYSYVTPTCNPSTRWEGGECGMRHLDRMPCTEEVGCRVRASECCECAVDTSIDNLFPMPNDYDAEALFCQGDEACCEAEPRYPDNVEARCEESECVLYVDGERLYR